MSTYQEMKNSIGRKRGRQPLPEAEKMRRVEARKIQQKQKLEAKRRASFVLQNRYMDEFTQVFEEEMAILSAENKITS